MFGRSNKAVCAALAVATAVSLAACDKGGGSSAAPGVDASTKTITIGSSAPKTGPQVAYYENIQVAQAAIARINAQGGINGWKLKLDVLDDGYQPARAISNIKQLVSGDKVFAIVTQTGTTGVAASLPYLAKTGTPDIGFVAEGGLLADPKLAEADNLFATVPAYAQVAAFIVDHLRSKNVSRFSIMYQDDDSGNAVVPGATYESQHGGPAISATVPVADSATDFSGYAARLKAAGAPQVVAWGPPPMVAGVMKASAAIGYRPKWLSPFFVPGPSFYSLVGSLAKNMEFESWLTPYTSTAPGVSTFLSTVRKAGDTNPSSLAEGAWVSIYTFAHALDLATRGGKKPTQAAVISALSNGKAFQPGDLGISVTYSASSRSPQVPERIYRYDGSALVPVTAPTMPPKVPASVTR